MPPVHLRPPGASRRGNTRGIKHERNEAILFQLLVERGAEAGEQERQANSRNCLWPCEQKHVLLVSFILLSVHQVPSSATSVSVLVLWWFEAGSEVQDGVGGCK